MKEFPKNILLSISAGLLLALAWVSPWFLPFLFIAFVPLLLLENTLKDSRWNKISVFFYSYLSFFLWNSISCWWIGVPSLSAAFYYFFENSLFMSLTFLLFHILANKIRKKEYNFYIIHSKQKMIYFTFIIVWISFEFLHLNWDFSWPWLTLGNALGFFPAMAQWYEYTGTLGGSLWILLTNIFIADIILNPSKNNLQKTRIFQAFGLLAPIGLSYLLLFTYVEKGTKTEVVILQPNFDSYDEKFPSGKKFIPVDKQLEIFFQLAEEKITPDTRYVLLPETAYPVSWELKDLHVLKEMQRFDNFRKKYKDLSLIMGLETFYRYESADDIVYTTRYTPGTGYFDYYNSAIQINILNETPITHKSKHLHWAESIPMRRFLNFMEPLTIYLGGFGSHGIQEERTVFKDKHNNKVATVICYESVHGSFVSDFINKGAQAIFIITNDGWWKKTRGHEQHLAYDKLRAIETRKSIARSANNGISCIINQKGEIEEHSEFWTRASVKGDIRLNRNKTVYTLLGDVVGKIAAFACLGLIILIVRTDFKKRFVIQKETS